MTVEVPETCRTEPELEVGRGLVSMDQAATWREGPPLPEAVDRNRWLSHGQAVHPLLALRPPSSLGSPEENLASNPTAGSTGSCGDIAAECSKGSEIRWKSMFPGRSQSGSLQAKCWENVSKRWVKQSGHDHLVTASQEFHSASLKGWPVNVLAQVDQRENPPKHPGLCLQAFGKIANLETCANDKAQFSIGNSYISILHVWSLKRAE